MVFLDLFEKDENYQHKKNSSRIVLLVLWSGTTTALDSTKTKLSPQASSPPPTAWWKTCNSCSSTPLRVLKPQPTSKSACVFLSLTPPVATAILLCLVPPSDARRHRFAATRAARRVHLARTPVVVPHAPCCRAAPHTLLLCCPTHPVVVLPHAQCY